MSENCPLCALPAGQILWQDELVCVINPGENRIPGFTRVVLKKHIAEMSALSEKERIHVMNAVNAVETLMLRMMRPDKVNLASLGNMVPHLHWHVIPRWKNDPWFPDSVWSAARRSDNAADTKARQLLAEQFFKALPRGPQRRLSVAAFERCCGIKLCQISDAVLLLRSDRIKNKINLSARLSEAVGNLNSLHVGRTPAHQIFFSGLS